MRALPAVRAMRGWVSVHAGGNPLAVAAALAVLALVSARSTISSFLVVEYVAVVEVPLLIPIPAAFLIGLQVSYGLGSIASTAPRALRGWRLVWLAGLLALYALALNAGCLVGPCEPLAVTRNLLLLSGVAVLGTVLWGTGIGWLPLLLYSLCFLFFGQTLDGIDFVRPWAIPLREVGTSSVVWSLVVVVGAAVAYAVLGSLPPGSRASLRSDRIT